MSMRGVRKKMRMKRRMSMRRRMRNRRMRRSLVAVAVGRARVVEQGWDARRLRRSKRLTGRAREERDRRIGRRVLRRVLRRLLRVLGVR